jgi:hypothetical protein
VFVKIYVASSWRNEYQPVAVTRLRQAGHDVYDFKDADGFHWSEIDPNWKRWTIPEYLTALTHPYAQRGFKRDMDALIASEICVYVLPCGRSASLEAGYAIGSGKPTAVWAPEIPEPDLMVKMAELITGQLEDIVTWIGYHAQFPGKTK